MAAPAQAAPPCPASPSRPYDWVFWDWNGTLLDDRDYAIAVRNRVFPRFGLPTMSSLAEYHRQFTFPVRVYYERAGVTDENFAEVAQAWVDEYLLGADAIPLHTDARETLRAFQAAGLAQAVLSASDQGIVSAQIGHYGLEPYFRRVLGLSHIYATSKLAIGQAFLAETRVPPHRCVLLGDTLHDAEVAQTLGMACILLSNGHQSVLTLAQAGVPVRDSLTAAASLVLGNDGNEGGGRCRGSAPAPRQG